jgi:hypothetical protein
VQLNTTLEMSSVMFFFLLADVTVDEAEDDVIPVMVL